MANRVLMLNAMWRAVLEGRPFSWWPIGTEAYHPDMTGHLEVYPAPKLRVADEQHRKQKGL